MDLKQLEYFVKVAELESVTRASTLLGITQPSLSRQIRLLEVELRQTLLLRNGRGVRPTEAGALLVKHARSMLAQADRALKEVAELRGVPMGRVTIGMPSSVGRFLSTPLAFAFKDRFPNAALSILEGQTYIMEWLSMGRVDIGVLINPQPSPNMDLVTLLKEPLYLVGGGDDAVGGQPKIGPPVPLKELQNFNLLLPSRPHAIRVFMESQLARLGVKLEVVCELDAFSAMLGLVRKGFGHGVMPASVFCGDELRSRYVLRRIVDPDLASVVSIATHSARPLSPLGTGVIALMQEIVNSIGAQSTQT